jgi:hypothetical protein
MLHRRNSINKKLNHFYLRLRRQNENTTVRQVVIRIDMSLPGCVRIHIKIIEK